MRQFIADHVSPFLHAIELLGGEAHDLVMEQRATGLELDAIEISIGTPLPSKVREFASEVSRRIAFHWYLPDSLELPHSLRGIFGGGLDFDVHKIPKHENSRAGWQAACFPDLANSYDQVWHHKLAFHEVPNGDYLAFDSDGRVVYLSHDDGEGHGYIIASSFPDLLVRWIPLGCPGGDWQWMPFVSSRHSGINPDSQNAKQWLQMIGRAP
jgi:hypothetical protein